MRVMSRVFQVVSYIELTKSVQIRGLTNETLMDNGAHIYEINDKGLKYIQTYKNEGKEALLLMIMANPEFENIIQTIYERIG